MWDLPLFLIFIQKKRAVFFGISAPLWRGLQNVIFAIGFNFQIAIIGFILIFTRNLIADFRDVGDDAARNIKTIPVILGIKRNQVWSFYAHIIFVVVTTIIWFNFSFLDRTWIWLIIPLQLISYPLTPRLSNPKCLDVYHHE